MRCLHGVTDVQHSALSKLVPVKSEVTDAVKFHQTCQEFTTFRRDAIARNVKFADGHLRKQCLCDDTQSGVPQSTGREIELDELDRLTSEAETCVLHEGERVLHDRGEGQGNEQDEKQRGYIAGTVVRLGEDGRVHVKFDGERVEKVCASHSCRASRASKDWGRRV